VLFLDQGTLVPVHIRHDPDNPRTMTGDALFAVVVVGVPATGLRRDQGQRGRGRGPGRVKPAASRAAKDAVTTGYVPKQHPASPWCMRLCGDQAPPLHT
jgi:hypothetical protein